MKLRGDETSYDACDVHTPSWAQVSADYEPIDAPTRLQVEVVDGVVVSEATLETVLARVAYECFTGNKKQGADECHD